MHRRSILRSLSIALTILCALVPLFNLTASPVSAAPKGRAPGGANSAATTPFSTVGLGTPAAPLQINVGTDLSYQILYNYNDGTTLADSGQIFPHSAQLADAGDFLWIGSAVYGPDFDNHDGGSAFSGSPIIPFTPVSQTKTGTGSSGDPYRVVTRVTAGAIQIDETITLVNGDHFATIRRVLTNMSGATVPISLFHGADIYLKGSDAGYGYYNASSQSVGGYNQTKDWYEVFTPVDPPQRYEETGYSAIWQEISNGGTPGNGLTPGIDATDYTDNGIALRWDRSLGAGQSTSVQDFHSFGTVPLIPSTPGVCFTPSPVVFDS